MPSSFRFHIVFWYFDFSISPYWRRHYGHWKTALVTSGYDQRVHAFWLGPFSLLVLR